MQMRTRKLSKIKMTEANDSGVPMRPLCIVLLCLFLKIAHAQPADTTTINKKRLEVLVYGGAIGYAATMTGLYQVWYKDSERQSFTFFNDNAEWKQLDKAGHFFSGFWFARGTSRALQWTGLRKDKSTLYAALTGFAVLVPIEILDGYSDAYGASSGDLVADAAGPLFYLGQQLLWREIRVTPKISFHPTNFAAQRPEVLGQNLAEQALKDYNGHTFWLSFDADKFFPFPKWLNIAVGYGAEEMIYARDTANRSAGLDPYRQYYLSLDFDLTAIKTRSKAVKALIFLGNMIRIPGPTLEFSRHKTSVRPFYF